MCRHLLRGFAVAMMAIVVAGCDKCGHPVHINTPSLPASCGGDEPAK